MKLRGKVALVTGSGRGLGRAYALRLAELGADVVINDVNLDAAREFNEPLSAPTVMDEVRACGGRSLGIQADVTKKDQVDAMVEQIVRDLGRIDILVNNAGGALTPFEHGFASMMPEADARFILDVNLMSTIFCCQAVAPHMKAQKSGKIINVSSQAGLRGNDTGALAHYCVSKAGVAEYTRLLAGELGPHNVTVNAIAPGVVITSRAKIQFGRGVDPVKTAEQEKRIPLRRLGTPEDCAKVVEFLATDLSDYVTGQVICVCGGMVLSPS
jgi:NAD(P)-dependent dehydrogenase (short-subunit alcohol dehydrogenase family)